MAKRLSSLKKRFVEYVQTTSSTTFSETLFGDIPLAIQLVNETGKTLFANRLFLEYFNFSSIEACTYVNVLGRHTPESYAAQLERERVRNPDEIDQTYSISIYSKNNKIRHLSVIRFMKLLDNERTTILVYIDITKSKAKNDALAINERQSCQANEALLKMRKALVDNVSHEIRTPMNRIMGFSSLLNDAAITDEERTFYFNEVMEGSNQLLTIINNLIKVSDIEAGLTSLEYQAVDMNELIETICAQVKPEADKKGLNVTVTISRRIKTPWITDYDKIITILINLLCNAIKFTASGQIDIGYQKHKDNLTLHVKDTGIGITQEEMSYIFDVFTKGGPSENMFKNGLGLGLTISKAYTKQLGGKLWAESTPGKGCTFYVTIPNGPL